MINKKEIVAMLLAGGQGSRLFALTQKKAKPAVAYGGKYRIIDFPLSNCANSGIDTVGVLTQYEPLELNSYIGTGGSWDLDSLNGGAYVLPPYVRGDSGDWYSGTADAIYRNINFVDNFDPEYIIVLSGDQICCMDYDKMLDYHKEKEADCTISVLNVSYEEAKRFGIMNTDDDNRIYEFEEKPAEPKSTKASMGIYIFNWKQLRKMLVADMDDPNSNHDFGKDIIPAMLAENKRLYAWKFKGYWKDVGTVDSLWEANMDLLSKNNELDLNDPNWKIYTEDVSTVPHYIGPSGKVDNAYINQGCVINGEINNSVLFTNVKVSKNAKVNDSVLLPDVEVGEGAVIHRAIVMQGVKIDAGAVVGDPNSEEIELISKRVRGE